MQHKKSGWLAGWAIYDVDLTLLCCMQKSSRKLCAERGRSTALITVPAGLPSILYPQALASRAMADVNGISRDGYQPPSYAYWSFRVGTGRFEQG